MSELFHDQILAERIRSRKPVDIVSEDAVRFILSMLSSKEKELFVRLPEMVADIPFERVARVEAGRNTPRNLSSFRLVPILPSAPIGATHIPLGRDRYSWPEGVKHWEGDKPPFIDASLGMGLVFNDAMHAVSSASVESDALRVVQLQGTIDVDPENPGWKERRRASGLHQGILWRDTLVQAWTEVAGAMGIENTELKGTGHTSYQLPLDDQRILRNYDTVARRMGYWQETWPGYWRRPISFRS